MASTKQWKRPYNSKLGLGKTRRSETFAAGGIKLKRKKPESDDLDEPPAKRAMVGPVLPGQEKPRAPPSNDVRRAAPVGPMRPPEAVLNSAAAARDSEMKAAATTQPPAQPEPTTTTTTTTTTTATTTHVDTQEKSVSGVSGVDVSALEAEADALDGDGAIEVDYDDDVEAPTTTAAEPAGPALPPPPPPTNTNTSESVSGVDGGKSYLELHAAELKAERERERARGKSKGKRKDKSHKRKGKDKHRSRDSDSRKGKDKHKSKDKDKKKKKKKKDKKVLNSEGSSSDDEPMNPRDKMLHDAVSAFNMQRGRSLVDQHVLEQARRKKAGEEEPGVRRMFDPEVDMATNRVDGKTRMKMIANSDAIKQRFGHASGGHFL